MNSRQSLNFDVSIIKQIFKFTYGGGDEHNLLYGIVLLIRSNPISLVAKGCLTPFFQIGKHRSLFRYSTSLLSSPSLSVSSLQFVVSSMVGDMEEVGMLEVTGDGDSARKTLLLEEADGVNSYFTFLFFSNKS